MHAIYTGSVPTHPGWFAIVVVWESIHAHHKFQHSSAYATFLAAAVTIVAGPIDVKHFEISEDREGLKRALEAPITGMSVLPVKKGKAAEFLSFYNDTYAKYVVGDTYNGMWFHYPYEDPYFILFFATDVCRFDFYAFYGWESEQAHYDNMKQEKHKGFHESFADCIDATRGCKVYHLELKKAYGDW